MIHNTGVVVICIIIMGLILVNKWNSAGDFSAEPFQLNSGCGPSGVICGGDKPMCINGVCSAAINQPLPPGLSDMEKYAIQPIANDIQNPATCVPDPILYANAYPDLKAAFGYNIIALTNHWNTKGKSEGRNGCWTPPVSLALAVYRQYYTAPVQGRYIRIRPSLTHGDGYMNISQLAVYGPSTVNASTGVLIPSPNNLARQRTVSSFPTDNTYSVSGPLSNVTDGIMSAREPATGAWHSKQGNRNTDYIDIDLGSMQNLYSFVIYGSPSSSGNCSANGRDNRMTGLRIQVLQGNAANASPVVEMVLPYANTMQNINFIHPANKYLTDFTKIGTTNDRPLTDAQATNAHIALYSTNLNVDVQNKCISISDMTDSLESVKNVSKQIDLRFDRAMNIWKAILNIGIDKFTNTIINATKPVLITDPKGDPQALDPNKKYVQPNVDNTWGGAVVPQLPPTYPTAQNIAAFKPPPPIQVVDTGDSADISNAAASGSKYMSVDSQMSDPNALSLVKGKIPGQYGYFSNLVPKDCTSASLNDLKKRKFVSKLCMDPTTFLIEPTCVLTTEDCSINCINAKDDNGNPIANASPYMCPTAGIEPCPEGYTVFGNTCYNCAGISVDPKTREATCVTCPAGYVYNSVKKTCLTSCGANSTGFDDVDKKFGGGLRCSGCHDVSYNGYDFEPYTEMGQESVSLCKITQPKGYIKSPYGSVELGTAIYVKGTSDGTGKMIDEKDQNGRRTGKLIRDGTGNITSVCDENSIFMYNRCLDIGGIDFPLTEDTAYGYVDSAEQCIFSKKFLDPSKTTHTQQEINAANSKCQGESAYIACPPGCVIVPGNSKTGDWTGDTGRQPFCSCKYDDAVYTGYEDLYKTNKETILKSLQSVPTNYPLLNPYNMKFDNILSFPSILLELINGKVLTATQTFPNYTRRGICVGAGNNTRLETGTNRICKIESCKTNRVPDGIGYFKENTVCTDCIGVLPSGSPISTPDNIRAATPFSGVKTTPKETRNPFGNNVTINENTPEYNAYLNQTDITCYAAPKLHDTTSTARPNPVVSSSPKFPLSWVNANVISKKSNENKLEQFNTPTSYMPVININFGREIQMIWGDKGLETHPTQNMYGMHESYLPINKVYVDNNISFKIPSTRRLARVLNDEYPVAYQSTPPNTGPDGQIEQYISSYTPNKDRSWYANPDWENWENNFIKERDRKATWGVADFVNNYGFPTSINPSGYILILMDNLKYVMRKASRDLGITVNNLNITSSLLANIKKQPNSPFMVSTSSHYDKIRKLQQLTEKYYIDLSGSVNNNDNVLSKKQVIREWNAWGGGNNGMWEKYVMTRPYNNGWCIPGQGEIPWHPCYLRANSQIEYIYNGTTNWKRPAPWDSPNSGPNRSSNRIGETIKAFAAYDKAIADQIKVAEKKYMQTFNIYRKKDGTYSKIKPYYMKYSSTDIIPIATCPYYVDQLRLETKYTSSVNLKDTKIDKKPAKGLVRKCLRPGESCPTSCPSGSSLQTCIGGISKCVPGISVC